MELYKIRNLINQGINIKDIHLRVTFYARVSTTNDLQINSLDNQITYFIDYIKNVDKWEYIPGYIDEGISGSSVKNRINFLKMINDAKQDQFDLILTKEVSRFSRNLVDSIKYTQELMEHNVGVIFETNGINTIDSNSEFILNMMSSVAQEEVKRLSMRIKWGHMNAIKRGRVLGSHITGYHKDKTKLVVDNEKSELVKLIFNLYATGKYGLTKLGYILSLKGYVNSKGNIYDKESLKRIIKNPKYKGYYQGHTTEVIDYKTKKRINVPLQEQIIYKDDNIPALVSESVWDKANQVLKSHYRSNQENIGPKYPYSGLLFCEHDHKVFIRTTGSKRSKSIKWACSNYIKYHLQGCASPLISEMDLDTIFHKILNRICWVRDNFTDKMLSYYQANTTKEIYYYETLKKRLIDLRVQDLISEDDFIEHKKGYDAKIALLKQKPNSLLKKTIVDILKHRDLNAYIKRFIKKVWVCKIGNQRDNLRLEVIVKNVEMDNMSFKFVSLEEKSKIKNHYEVFIKSDCSN